MILHSIGVLTILDVCECRVSCFVVTLSPSTLAVDEGRVGNYWYHKASAIYFHDDRQYNEAWRACTKLQRAEVGDEEGR
jgi:hypothetical protein